MIYVASPYSSPIPELVEQRYTQVCSFVDALIRNGFHAFSPVVYCHPIAKRIGANTDAATWHSFNMTMLRKAEAMYLLELSGWQESKGIKTELNVCKILGIPVVHYSPKHVLLTDAFSGVTFSGREQ